jgi:hypothetical protein
MKHNVIILTSGLSGSSVLTGLIARAGYWTGDTTFRKQEYETFENQALIDLNLKIIQEAGYEGNYLVEFSRAAMQRIASLSGTIDCTVYRLFLEKCAQNQPWVWKDPRLWLTIRFWKSLLDVRSCRFILLTRGTAQSWVSSTLNRQILSYRYFKDYEDQIQQSAIKFLEENHLPFLHLTYEDLIMHPAEVLNQLNPFLNISLTIRELERVYHKPLYKNPRNSWFRHLKAVLIFLKNYSSRVDLVAERE